MQPPQGFRPGLRQPAKQGGTAAVLQHLFRRPQRIRRSGGVHPQQPRGIQPPAGPCRDMRHGGGCTSTMLLFLVQRPQRRPQQPHFPRCRAAAAAIHSRPPAANRPRVTPAPAPDNPWAPRRAPPAQAASPATGQDGFVREAARESLDMTAGQGGNARRVQGRARICTVQIYSKKVRRSSLLGRMRPGPLMLSPYGRAEGSTRLIQRLRRYLPSTTIG